MNFNLFSTIFTSIILEAFPFLLLGTFLSSIIEVFTTEDFFKKIIPKNKYLSLLLASVTGLVFPVCECAIVPIAGRLLKKGVPLYFTITFMLSVPIVNITVMLSTYYAFSTHLHLLFLRIGLGIIIPIIIGFLISFIKKPEDLILNKKEIIACACGIDHGHDHGFDHLCDHAEYQKKSTGITAKLFKIIEHTVEEFFETGKYFIVGALITSLFQSVVPRSMLVGISSNVFLSILIMMIFAFLLSVCSQTDAFIARSFLGQFTQGSVLAFVVFGAMLDLKNAMMFKSVFKTKFIYFLIGLIVVVCFIFTGIIGIFLGV
jgi:uncharacterized protein